VIALHTNFDLASEALSRELAGQLGFEFKGFLTPRGGSELPVSARFGKFVTYVPADHLDKVRQAVCDEGAGVIGNYTQCSFSWGGEGTFLGGAGSNPTVGRAGKLEKAEERRLEVVFPWRKLQDVTQAARAAHPYEEMAFEVLELAQPSRPLGYGFVADVAGARAGSLAFHKIIQNVKESLRLRSVTVAGPGLSEKDMPVRRLAFSPGAGSSFVGAASAKGADVYVCGEVGYHQMLEARQKGLTLVVLGHSYSERFFIETVSSWCETTAKPVKKVFETVHENL
jgi:hypothetical protein